MKKIAVIILNYNGFADTHECLRSLTTVKRTGLQLLTVVVDNASKESPEILVCEFPEVTLLKNSTNLGYAEGNNVGIREALKHNADFVLILNNDTVVDQYCFIELLKASDQKPSGGIFGPKIYFYKGREFHKSRYKKNESGKVFWYAGGRIDWDNVLVSHRGVDEVDHGQYDTLTKTPFMSGCAMFVRRDVFEKIGLFDNKLYLYYEDLDFCKRAEKNGIGSWYVPKATIWHKNAGTAGGSGSDLQSYYMTRNRLLIGIRYAPFKSKLALLKEGVTLLMKGTSTQKEAVKDFLTGNYGARKNN